MCGAARPCTMLVKDGGLDEPTAFVFPPTFALWAAVRQGMWGSHTAVSQGGTR